MLDLEITQQYYCRRGLQVLNGYVCDRDICIAADVPVFYAGNEPKSVSARELGDYICHAVTGEYTGTDKMAERVV